ATIISKGLEKADIDIVGGDSIFFDKLIGAISVGKSVDGFVGNSTVATSLAGPWLDGSSSFADDLGKLLGKVNTADVTNLTLSAFLLQQIKAGGNDQGKLRELLTAAEKLGVADAPLAALNARG
ncbi:MAG TPA: flotillin family protein, partial [Asanoa sp.]|nr:flotillin family protein [Asanoa sp.]